MPLMAMLGGSMRVLESKHPICDYGENAAAALAPNDKTFEEGV